MFLSRVQIFIATKLGYIVLPILILVCLFLFGNGSFIDNIVYIFFVGNFIFFLYKTANWEYTSYYSKYVFGLIFLVIAFRNLIFINRGIENILDFNVLVDVSILFPALFFMYLNIGVVRASIKPKNCINLLFPFKEGKYSITNGGDGNISSLVNYHTKAQVHKSGKTETSMRYATDIVKLKKFGYTVKNVLSTENKDYETFHEKVYSPCEATVIAVVDGMEDNIPFSGNYPYSVGNHVVLKIKNNYIVMGHLEKGSIKVKEGDKVKPEQQLAIIGNCGLTPSSHLHMQVSECEDGLYWQGKGVPIFFNGLGYPIKNKIIKI